MERSGDLNFQENSSKRNTLTRPPNVHHDLPLYIQNQRCSIRPDIKSVTKNASTSDDSVMVAECISTDMQAVHNNRV